MGSQFPTLLFNFGSLLPLMNTYLSCFLVLLTLCSNSLAFSDDAAVLRPLAAVFDDGNLIRGLTLPPHGDGPLEVYVTFHLLDVNRIDESTETFEFSGVLTLKWKDERQKFDPGEAGIKRKTFQGDFQSNELSPSWSPQVVLVNSSGQFEISAVTLFVDADGTCTLLETITAPAEAKLDLRRTPFDSQKLEAIFEIFGYDTSEIKLVTEPLPPGTAPLEIRIPQWEVTSTEQVTRTIHAPYAKEQGIASAFVLSIGVQRESLFLLRLVVLPLMLIVMLSWSVFWMDRSSVGDRMSISFVGILTAVSYQVVLGDILPQISYVTFMNSFINISFVVMCTTVVINLIVGAAEKKGSPSHMGEQIDKWCRVAFPVVYFALLLLALGISFQ
jgi:hypothetical protein